MQDCIRIATRQSPLALWQATFVKDQIQTKYPEVDVELIGITTKGDKLLETSLAKIGGKGLFIKELENALYDGRADIAVHSMKDMTVILPEKLTVAAVLSREDPRDSFISNQYDSLTELPSDGIIGTSSLRRQAIIKQLRPDLNVEVLRGNVNSRLQKLDSGNFDAILLAYAGVKRLGLTERVRAIFSPEEMLPAIGQGIIGIECHEDNQSVLDLIKTFDHHETRQRLTAERSLNASLDGGCQMPVAGFATLAEENNLWLRGAVGMPDGSRMITADATLPATKARELGQTVAQTLLDNGAEAILACQRS